MTKKYFSGRTNDGKTGAFYTVLIKWKSFGIFATLQKKDYDINGLPST